MRSSSLASTRFPLPEGAFGPLSLSPAQRDAFRAQCEARVRAALDECERADSFGHEAYGAPWELAGMQDQCSVMRKRETATRAQYRLMADLVGDYKDMMELMYAETSHDTYEWMQFLYQEVVDAHVLESFEKGSTDNAHHYFGVKWAVQQASMFSGKADQLFVEYMTYRKDLRGRDIGVRVMLPVRLGEVDHPMEAMKVRRLSSEVVIIMRPVYESKRSTTRLFVMVDNDFPGSVPTSYSHNLLGMAHNMPLCADSRRIRRRGLISEKSWVSNSSRRSCIVCTRNFGAARGRHHCRLCGDVICRKCMLVRDTADPVTKKTFKIAKTKFCVLCVTKLRLPDVEDFTNSGLVSAIKANAIEAAPIDLGDATRASHNSHNSLWSETESEDCRTDVEHSDSARSSISSSTEQDGGKPSFGLRLQDIAERSEDSATEDAGTKQPKPETVLFVPDETTDSEEFMITIDTKDMIRDGYSLNSSNPLSSSGVYDDPTNERRRSNPLSSIDQSLAEQEALLRQLVLATHGVTPSHNRHVDKRYGEYGH